MKAHEITEQHKIKAAVNAGEIKRCRQSLLNTADICLRRAQYTLDPNIAGGTSEAAVVGTAYHAALEIYYQWRRASSIFLPAMVPDDETIQAMYAAITKSISNAMADYGDRLRFDTTPAEAVARAHDMLYTYMVDARYWDDAWQIVAVEREFYLPPVDGWTNSGTIDLVVKCMENDVPLAGYNFDAGDIVIVDHKTAGKPWPKGRESPRKTNQPAFYVNAWEQLTGQRPVGMVFDIMSYNLAFERRFVEVGDLEDQMLAKKRHILLPMLANPELELPGNQQSFLCSEKWCDFWFTCPFGAGGELEQRAA